jgi:hypothetical protein
MASLFRQAFRYQRSEVTAAMPDAHCFGPINPFSPCCYWEAGLIYKYFIFLPSCEILQAEKGAIHHGAGLLITG